MIDMKWIRNDPEKVKENIRKKFQDEKLPLVDEVVELDQKFRKQRYRATNSAASGSLSARRSVPSWDRAKRKKPKLSRQR